jgi:flagellar L-ring protein precursor FlgH
MRRRIALPISIALVALALSGGTLHAQEKTPPQRGRASWTSDRRDFAVGDVITVMLDESTLATATKGQSGSDETSRDMGVGIDPPNMGVAPMPSIDAKVGTSKRAQSRQQGQARRDVRFMSEMSVRVVAVGPTGLLQVKGQKLVDIDKNRQEYTLTGWVRPEDVNAQNVIASPRVADAQLVYSMKGSLGKTRGGIIGRIIGVVWP